ncbi:hypothetical protein SAMN05192564_10969 [Paraburkholderia sartisoli]|uniref:Uncharacterized protein n=1 Tax=Paraburkholderia sartisoli TaxID=83784 RepID=A0A1H4HHJ1_9BURK|nr:hypothetical protein SAMN05192564_10969 [Paraburkholderia sartisoli]
MHGESAMAGQVRRAQYTLEAVRPVKARQQRLAPWVRWNRR